MDAFWCIFLGFFLLRWFIKSENKKRGGRRKELPVTNPKIRREIETLEREISESDKEERQKKRDIEELRKQGYTDDFIAIILPTINNGK